VTVKIGPGGGVIHITVVIPTWNEAQHLPGLLDELLRRGGGDAPEAVVVADCESTDDTVALATAGGARVVDGQGLDSRAAALQAGLDHALALEPGPDVIFFLHADSSVPVGWRGAIERSLQRPGTVGGAFTQRFMQRGLPGWSRRLLRFVTFCNRTRYRLTRSYFGDQGIFATVAALEQVGGIPQLDLLEDVELCRQLRQVGKLALCREKVSTSPRRFLHHGILRQLLADWLILLVAIVGLRVPGLHQRYNRDPG